MRFPPGEYGTAIPHACCSLLRRLDCLDANGNAERNGEVRESGLTGVTRNHVCPRGTGGSNPPLSASDSARNSPAFSADARSKTAPVVGSYVSEFHFTCISPIV